MHKNSSKRGMIPFAKMVWATEETSETQGLRSKAGTRKRIAKGWPSTRELTPSYTPHQPLNSQITLSVLPTSKPLSPLSAPVQQFTEGEGLEDKGGSIPGRHPPKISAGLPPISCANFDYLVKYRTQLTVSIIHSNRMTVRTTFRLMVKNRKSLSSLSCHGGKNCI